MNQHNKLAVLLILSLIFCSALSYNMHIRNLGAYTESKGVLEKEIYVTENSKSYYAYRVYSTKGKIEVRLVDQDVKSYKLTFQSKGYNVVEYRAAYNKFIIVEEKTSAGKTVSYWLLTITKTTSGYSLSSFAISSTEDNEGYKFQGLYKLTSVIQYNEKDQFLYVSHDSILDYNVYGIDLAKKSDKLITIGWFYYSLTKREKIVGGNSRVLVEGVNDQFWFDTRNKRVNDTDPTVYDKVNASSLTNLPIYSQGSQTYSFLSSYFQYVSLSSNKLKLTTFIYKGYEKSTTVYEQASIKSNQKAIKVFSDQQTFFLAVGDSDVYLSIVDWNPYWKKYQTWSTTLKKQTCSPSQKNYILEVFNSVVLAVYNKGKLFMLSEKYLYVYSKTNFEFILLDKACNSQSDLQVVILTEIKKYYKKSCY